MAGGAAPSSHMSDSQEGATAFIKGPSKTHLCLVILKVPAGPQGGLVPDPEAGGSGSPSALTHPSDEVPPRPETQLTFVPTSRPSHGPSGQGWLRRKERSVHCSGGVPGG